MARSTRDAPTPTSRRGARATAGAVTAAVLLVGAGAYGVADAYDVVPGLVTLDPPHPEPAPFPTPPAALAAPELPDAAGPPDPAAPLPAAEDVAAWARAAVDHRWIGTSTSVLVADVLTGDVLAEVAPDVPQEPASTAKVLTGAAAVLTLGPDATLRTRVVQESPGRLLLVGGGDVMLAAGEGDPTATNGRAGLGDLAAEAARLLALAGTTEVTVDVDDSLFTGPPVAPGWADTDLTGGYVAPVTAIAVNIAKTTDGPYPPRHADPSLHAARTFATQLEAHGVTVTRPPTRRSAPESATELAAVESAPVADVVRYVLQTSDNTVAEALGRLVALHAGLPGSFEGATTAVLAEVARLGVDVTGARLADASGLADGSQLSARTLVDLVRRTHTEPALRTVAVGMPVGGWQGTLADRFRTPPATGLVRAKTGSLVGTTSLAGTVTTPEGRTLAFAVLADETPPGGQLGPRRVIDGFVQQLAGCDCPLP